MSEGRTLQRQPSATGMVDSEAAEQHDVDVEDMNVFRQKVKFTEALFDHVLGLPSPNLPTHFCAELRRWEARHGKPVVHDCMCLILSSRFGLTGLELQSLLHLTEAQWVSLRASISPYLKATNVGSTRDGQRVRFFIEKAYDPELTVASTAVASTAGLNKSSVTSLHGAAAAAALSEGAEGDAPTMSVNLAMRVAGMAARLAHRRRKLTRVHEWPPVRPAVMRYFHTALGGFFAARAAGLTMDAASLSILTGTAALPRKSDGNNPNSARPSSRGSSRPGSSGSGRGLGNRPRINSGGGKGEESDGEDAKTSRSSFSQSSWTTARKSLWAKLRMNVRMSKEVKKYYMLRVKQASKHLHSLFAQRIKSGATALPRRFRDASGKVQEGFRIGRWVSRGDEGTTSGLRFTPYHLLQASRQREAQSVLLDLQYVEAMAASGYVYELIDCLCHLQSTTEHTVKTLSSKVAEIELEEEAKRRGEGKTGGGGPAFLSLVQSEGFELLAVKEKLKRALHRRKCVNELLEFVRAEVTTLSRFPSMTFQLAACRPDSTLLAHATKLHRAKGKERRPYLRWVNKPQHRDPCVLVLPGVESAVTDMDYSKPDGATLATGTKDGHIVLWNIQTGTVKQLLCQPQPGASDEASESAARSSAAGDFKVSEGGADVEEEEAPPAHPEDLPETVSVTRVRFHPSDSRYLVAADSAGRVYQWDVETQQHRPLVAPGVVMEDDDEEPPAPHAAPVTSLQWDDSGRLLASGDEEGYVCLWKFNSEAMWSLDNEAAPSPQLWACWQAQESEVRCLRFGHADWRPELELGSRSGTAAGLGSTGYRSPTHTPTPATPSPRGGRRKLASLVDGDSLLTTMDMHLSSNVLGPLSSMTHPANSVRVRTPQAYIVERRADGRGSPDLSSSPPAAPSSPTHRESAVPINTSLSQHGVSYGSMLNLRKQQALAERKRQHKNSRQLTFRVSPVVMGNHTHAMFPHGTEAALVASMPVKLRKKAKRVWQRPKLKSSVRAALKSKAAKTVERDAGVAECHSPWQRKSLRLGGGVTPERRGKMLRTSASMPALAQWSSKKRKMVGPAIQGPAADWDIGFGAEPDPPSSDDEYEEEVVNARLRATVDDEKDDSSLDGDEANERHSLLEGDILLLSSGASTMYCWRVSPAGDASKVGQTVGETLAIRATARGVTGVIRRTNNIVKCVASTGERVGLAEAAGGDMIACAFSPSRDRVAAVMTDKSVRVYVAATGQRVGNMDGHRKEITSAAWAPDGYHLATGSVSGEVRVWLPHIIAKVGPQPQHQSPVASIAVTSYHTNGKMATVSTDGDVKMWKMSDGKMFAHEEAHKSGVVQTVEFQGRSFYERCNVITTGGMRRWIPEIGAPGSLAYKDMELANNARVWDTSPIGDLFAFCNLDGLDGLQVVNTLTYKLRTNFATDEVRMVRLVKFSPDCRLLLLAMPAGIVKVYDLAQARHVAVGVKQSQSGSTTHLANDPTHAHVDRTPIAVLEDIYRQSVQDLRWSPDGQHLIWLTVETPVIKLWNVIEAIKADQDDDPMARYKVNIITNLTGHDTVGSMNVTEACWDSTGQRVASAGYDGSLRVWDANDGKCVKCVAHAHDGHVVQRVVWGLTNERLVTSGEDRTVRVWNPVKGTVQCLWLLPPPAVVKCLALNMLANTIVIGDQRGGVSILKLEGVKLSGKLQDSYVPEAITRNVPRSVGGKKGGSGLDAQQQGSPGGPASGSSSAGKAEEKESGEASKVEEPDFGVSFSKGGAASDSMSTWTSVPIATITRLYYNEKHLWHSKLTVACAYCDTRFNVFLQMIDIVKDVRKKMQLEGPRPMFFKDPRLVMRCLHCKQPHRLNPFILDNPLGLK